MYFTTRALKKNTSKHAKIHFFFFLILTSRGPSTGIQTGRSFQNYITEYIMSMQEMQQWERERERISENKNLNLQATYLFLRNWIMLTKNYEQSTKSFIGLVINGTTFWEYQDCSKENMSKQDWKKQRKKNTHTFTQCVVCVVRVSWSYKKMELRVWTEICKENFRGRQSWM